MKFSDIPQFTRMGSWECNFSFQSLIREIDRMEKEEGLVLNPDFQRGHVWSEEQQTKYIEFILKGGKTARVIYLNNPQWHFEVKSGYKGFVCVDGLQRITAIRRFVNNEIKAFGYYLKEYEDSMRNKIDMRLHINDLQTKKEVLQWYLDFNDGGTPHTEEEINRVKSLLEECNDDKINI